MKKTLIQSVSIAILVLFFSCKKESKNSTFQFKLVAEAADYSLTVRSQEGTEYLNKKGISGLNTFIVYPKNSENISIAYSTNGGITLKTYVNDKLNREYKMPAGSGVVMLIK